MSLIPRMADSTEPWNIPQIFEVRPNGAAYYADGKYEWTAGERERFPRRIGITVTGAPAMAQHARVIDVERFDATPADVPYFLAARRQLGHVDGEVYCDRSTVAQVLAAIDGREPEPWWWIATLDGIAWTPESLAANIRAEWGVSITPARVRAIQWLGRGAWDESRCFGQTWASDQPAPEPAADQREPATTAAGILP